MNNMKTQQKQATKVMTSLVYFQKLKKENSQT
jgi:hypothetical protein